jgi:predicted permease
MRHIVRSLSRQPAWSATIVATLAAALAFMIASVAILDQLLFHPYPYPRLRQLLLVRDSRPREGAHQGRSVAVADFLDAQRSVPAFTALAGWHPQPLVVTSAGAEPERIEAAAVTANFFTTLGVVPVLGHPFAADADKAGRDTVVLLSRRLWNARFGADPSVVGREIGLNGRSTTIIGIVRDKDCYPPGVDAWVPLVFSAADAEDRAAQPVAAIGRLDGSATDADASGQLASLAHALAVRYPKTSTGRGFDVVPLLREQYEFTAPLFLFVLAAALLVLALAVVNVTNLLVARTLDRRRELAVRAMLGAGSVRVAGAAVGEVLLLVTAAIVASTFGARGLVDAIRASLPEGIARWIAGWSSLRLDARALAAGCAVGLLVATALCAAVAIASLGAARAGVTGLRVTRRSSLGRRILVAAEMGLAAALLVGAAVMVAGFSRISAAYETMAPSRVLRFTLTLPENRYPDSTRIALFHDALLDRIRGLPGVENVALIRNEPASNVPNPILAFDREDRPALQPGDMSKADVEVVSPSVFETLRLAVLAGRSLTIADGVDSSRVAVISQTAAKQLWPDRNPVGTTIRFERAPRPVRIVGVVADLTLNWYDPQPRPTIFLPDAQSPARTTSVIVRTHEDPMSLARAVRAAVARLDDRQPVSGVEPLSTTIADSLSPVRIIEHLLLVGAAVAAALAAIGIYGVFAQWVASRQRELGVRFALGATRRVIAWLVLRDALTTASIGLVAGVASAALAVRLAAGTLLGVPSLSVASGLGVTACAVALALAGSLGPARRAARVDVADLLRFE